MMPSFLGGGGRGEDESAGVSEGRSADGAWRHLLLCEKRGGRELRAEQRVSPGHGELWTLIIAMKEGEKEVMMGSEKMSTLQRKENKTNTLEFDYVL
jgi:hypothetical protein